MADALPFLTPADSESYLACRQGYPDINQPVE